MPYVRLPYVRLLVAIREKYQWYKRDEGRKNLHCSFCKEIKAHIKIKVFYFMGTASKQHVGRRGCRCVVKRSGINCS